MAGKLGPQQPVVLLQGRFERVARTLPEPGGTLDVREQERQGHGLTDLLLGRQRRSDRDARQGNRQWAAQAGLALDLAGQGAKRCGRLLAHLLVQQTLEFLVLAQRRTRLPRRSQQAHDPVVHLLAQGFPADRLTRVLERAADVAARFEVSDQFVYRLEVQPREALLLAGDPILIEAGKQRPRVQVRRLSERLDAFGRALRPGRSLERGLKCRDIGGNCGRVEPHAEAIRLNDGSGGRAGRLHLVAKRRERNAETGTVNVG